jgi:hypothetical protein
MFSSFLKRMAGSQQPRRSPAAPGRRTALHVEHLEDRLVPSGQPIAVPWSGPPLDYFKITGAPARVALGTGFSVTVMEYAYATNKVVTGPDLTVPLTFTDGTYSWSLGNVTLHNGTGKAMVTPPVADTGYLYATLGLYFNSRINVTGTSSTITVLTPPNGNSNWAGYDITPGSQVSAVAGSWVQPAISGSGGMGIWVGIDGANNSTLEQIGTGAYIDANTGAPTYYAWYEMVPNNPYVVPINYTNSGAPFVVQPGDHISAAVRYLSSSGTNSTFQLLITDTPVNGGPVEFFSTKQTMANVQRASAEWIVEETGDGSGNLYNLPNFGSVTFTGAWATVGSTTGPINVFPSSETDNIVDSSGKAKTATSQPSLSSSLGYLEQGRSSSQSPLSSNFTVTFTY